LKSRSSVGTCGAEIFVGSLTHASTVASCDAFLAGRLPSKGTVVLSLRAVVASAGRVLPAVASNTSLTVGRDDAGRTAEAIKRLDTRLSNPAGRALWVGWVGGGLNRRRRRRGRGGEGGGGVNGRGRDGSDLGGG
jgi:hypothetical protein